MLRIRGRGLTGAVAIGVALSGAQLPLAAVLAAPATAAPLAAYPMPPALPVADNRLPSFVDDDELVHVGMDPQGRVVSMRSDVRLKVSGSGDYVVRLPGQVKSVADLGGDSVPGLAGGHVSFLGHLDGGRLLAASAELDPAAYAGSLPLHVGLMYTSGNATFDPAHPPPGLAAITQTLTFDNLTAAPVSYVQGVPDRLALATALTNLQAAPGVYTPETDMQAKLPMPATLPMRGSVQPANGVSYVPLAAKVTLTLDSTAQVIDPAGGDVTRDKRGTRVAWNLRLPADTTGSGSKQLRVVYQMPTFRVPALDAAVTVVPLPASVFASSRAATWTDDLAAAADSDLPPLALLAQAGALSLHRIADAIPPVNRPGSGPERVSYDFVLDSGQRQVAAPATPAPVHGQWWAFALAAAVVVAATANAWWAWSRN